MATRKNAATRTRTASSRSNGRAKPADALRLLKEDHARVKALFEKFERTSAESGRQAIAEEICMELRTHALLEESVFYPRVREAIDEAELLEEAEIEHASAKDLIAQIEESTPSEPRFEALVTVLREYVMHHVKEEETEMFRQVRGTQLDLAALGEEMQEWKAGAVGDAGRGSAAAASEIERSPRPA
jgi:hypothetical protein